MSKQNQLSLNTKPKSRTKPKSKAPKGASRNQRSIQQQQQQRKTAVPTVIVNRTCGIVDPFCDHAIAAKYPDNSSTRTLPFTWRKMGTLTSDANGKFAVCFLPKYNVDCIWDSATLVGSGVVGWTNTSYAGVIAATSYRIVSVGLILKKISAPLYASGSVHLRSWVTDDLGTTFGAIDVASYNCSRSMDVSFQASDELTIIPERTPQPQQTFYKTSGDYGVLVSNTMTGYYPVTIYGTGLPVSTDVFTYQLIVHYEITLPDGDGLAQLATRPPIYNPVVVTAAKQATSAIATFAKEGVRVVSSSIANGIRSRLTAMLNDSIAGTAMLVD